MGIARYSIRRTFSTAAAYNMAKATSSGPALPSSIDPEQLANITPELPAFIGPELKNFDVKPCHTAESWSRVIINGGVHRPSQQAYCAPTSRAGPALWVYSLYTPLVCVLVRLWETVPF